MVKPQHRPLAAYRTLSSICVVLLLAACVLSLLVGLSLPIIKPVYLLRFYSITSSPTDVATELRFGVWGVCATSAFNQPTLLSNTGECFGPRLGYAIPDSIISLTGISPAIVQTVLKVLLTLLVLHLVVAGLSLITLVSSLFLASHALSILALLLAVITALVSTGVFGIDLALVIVAKSQIGAINTASHLQFAIQWGNAPWLGLAATVLTWLSVIALSARACYCFGVRRRHHHHHHHSRFANAEEKVLTS